MGVNVFIAAAGKATILVSGANSKWTSTAAYFADATLSLLDGGVMQTNAANIGTFANKTTNVLISGADSKLDVSSLIFGTNATASATITVADRGTLSISGGTRILSIGGGGTINIGGAISQPSVAAGTLDVASVTLSNGALNFNHSDSAYSFDLAVSGTGTLRQTGTGTTILTATNSFTGDTIISGGTLQVANDGNLGAAANALTFSGGTLQTTADFASNRAVVLTGTGTFQTDLGTTLTLDGSASGLGSLTKNGSGTLILTGTNSYAGPTTVGVGTLQINGNQSAATGVTSVLTGATLGGSGIIGGDVTVADGATLAPGNGIGTLTINGNLTLAAASQVNYELGAANTVGGPLNDLTVVRGNLTLDGTLNVTQSASGTYGAGIYRLINYSGTLIDNGLEQGSMPAGSTNYIQTSVANQINLVNSNGLFLNFWDGDAGGKNDGAIAGGDGTWVAGTVGGTDKWTQADGLINAPYQDAAFAVFTGAAGTVTVDNSQGAVRVSGMNFAIDGYTIVGGDVTLIDGTDAIRVGDGTSDGAATTATIASALIGTGKLDKADLGKLILTGANTYTGGTTISDGFLQIGSGGTSGSIVGNVIDNSGLAFNRLDTSTYEGTISGTGTVSQIGTGTTVVTGHNTYTGTTIIGAGTWAAGAADALSGGSAHSVYANATLALQSFSQTIASLNNAGMVRLGATPTSTPGTILTVAGNYAGTGGQLLLNVALGNDSSQTDKLVINGNATGSTLTTINNVGGIGAATTGDGIQIVKVGGTSAAGAFTLAGGAIRAGAYQYQLYLGSVTNPGDQDWYLRSQTRSIVQPTIALARIAQDIGLTMLGTLHERVGEQERLSQDGASSGAPGGLWGRMIGKDYTNGSRSSAFGDGRSTGQIGGLQMGADLYRGMSDDGSQTKVGIFGGHVWAGSTEYRIGSSSPYAGTTKADGWAAGAYATHYARGWYADAVIQGSWLDLRANAQDGTTFKTKSNSWLASLEVGAPLSVGSGFIVEPEAQIIYGSTDLNDRADSLLVVNSFEVKDSVTGRLGFRLKRTWDYDANSAGGLFTPFVTANVWSRLGGGGTDLTIAGSPQGQINYAKTWADIGGGTTFNLTSKAVLFVDAAAEFGLDRKGTNALSGHAGVRLQF
jgi:fibronectin-binding autotransporter adhesin